MNHVQLALTLDRARRSYPNRASFRAFLKSPGEVFRQARKMVFGSYGRGLTNHFNRKQLEALREKAAS